MRPFIIQVEVEMLDGPNDGSYRFERGTEDYVEYASAESFDDKSDAREAFGAKLAKREMRRSDNIVFDARITQDDNDTVGSCDGNDDDEDDPRIRLLPPKSQIVPSVAPAPSQASRLQRLPSKVDLTEDTLQDCEPLAPTLAGYLSSSRGGRSIAGSDRGRGSSGRRRSPAHSAANTTVCEDDDEDDGGEEHQDGQGNQLEAASDAGASGRGSRRKQDERDLDESKKALEKAKHDFGNDSHLDHSRQASTCSKAVDKLRKWARKLSKSQDEECRNFSQTLFDYSDEIEERQSLFDDAKVNFSGSVLSTTSKPRSAILRTMGNANICALVAREATRASDEALNNEMMGQALFKCLVGPGAPESHQAPGLGLHLVKDDLGLVANTQRPSLHNHLEKILKEPSLTALANASSRFFGCLADMGADEIASSLANADIGNGTSAAASAQSGARAIIIINGWEGQLWMDLSSCFAIGEVAKSLAKNSRIPGQLNKLIKEVVRKRQQVSGRIRCYHKHIGGVAHTSRDCWTAMEDVASKDVVVVNVTVDEVDTWIVTLRSARLEGKDIVELLCALGEIICCEAAAKVTELGKWCVFTEETGDQSQKELMGAALNFSCELRECIGKVIRDTGYHVESMQPFKPLESETQVFSDEATDAADKGKASSGSGSGVIDMEYWKDPDNLSDAAAMVGVTGTCASVLKQFPASEAELNLVQEVEVRAHAVLQTWKASRCTITEQNSEFDHLRRLVQLVRENKWNRTCNSRKTSTSPAYEAMNTFCDKAIAADVPKAAIVAFTESVLQEGKVPLVSLQREMAATQELQVEGLHGVVKAFLAVERAAEEIGRGKTPSMPELNNVLHNAVEAMKDAKNQSLQTSRQKYNAAKLLVGQELGSAFALFESRLARMTAGCAKMEKLACNICSEIATWQFDTCNFIKLPKDKANPEVMGAAKVIENAMQNFEQWKQSAAVLAANAAHQPESMRKKVSSILSMFDNGKYEGMLKHAAVLLAHCSLASVVYPKKSKKDWPDAAAKMLNHVRSVLMVADSELDQDFLAALVSGEKNVATSAGSSTDGKKRLSSGSTSSQATASTAAPSSAASVASFASGPAAKFRRRG